MSRGIFTVIILLALLTGCNSPEPMQPRPTVTVPYVEPEATDDDASYVAPRGMTRAEVYAMLEERSRETREALEAKKRRDRRPRWDPVDVHLGVPLYWHYGYYDHCWSWYGHPRPWHGHYGVHLGTCW